MTYNYQWMEMDGCMLSDAYSPEQRLWLNVVKKAFLDAVSDRAEVHERGRYYDTSMTHKQSAVNWLLNKNPDRMNNSEYFCELAGIEVVAEIFRKRLRGEHA